MKMAYGSVCRSRDHADWARHNRGITGRQREQTHELVTRLNAFDMVWCVGERIRKSRMAEINTPTVEEQRESTRLQATEVLPVVSVIGPKPALVGTVRTNCEFLNRPQFRLAAMESITTVFADSDNMPPSMATFEAVTFIRRLVASDTYQWEVGVDLITLAMVGDFEFVNGLYKDDEDNWVHIQDGVRYLAGSAGSLVISCRRCGVEQMMNARSWFINAGGRLPGIEYCTNCDRSETLEPVRMDELYDRWLPFWRLVDGPY